MDQWTEATWLSRANPPTLRAVPGRSVRVLRRPDEPDASFDPDPLPVLPELPGTDAAPGTGGIRVLVVSDDVLARRGVLVALDDQPGIVVVGDRLPGPGVAAAILSRDPDVVLLHGLSGAGAEPTLTAVRQASRSVRVLVIGERGEPSALDAGGEVCGRLAASASPEEVVAAVRMAAAGYVLNRGIPARPAGGRDAALAQGLTVRECDVLALVAKGMSNAEIAEELTLSEHTVKSHMQNLLGKLNLRNRIHAVIYAFETGLAGPGSM
jgi:DNA-binding NarL/FixJ family response regulator